MVHPQMIQDLARFHTAELLNEAQEARAGRRLRRRRGRALALSPPWRREPAA